jgi:phospholipid/cholesterol/gamma-HCH transport system substrate-binding protein
MITKEQKVRLSIFLVTAAILFIIILAAFIYPKLKEKGEVYYINFKGTSVNGLNNGSDVKYQGVKIGIVKDIEVNPTDLDSILVYVRIQPKFPVMDDMRAALVYAGITGLRFVEISGGHAHANLVPPGGEILTQRGLGEKAEDIVLNVDNVVQAINDMLDKKNREKFASLLSNLEKSTDVISGILEKREKNFVNSIEKFDATMTEIIQLTENLKSFSEYLNGLSERAPIEGLVKESETLIKQLSQRFSQQEMGKTLENLDTFLSTTTSSIRKISNRFIDLESELSKTLASLRESLENIASFTRDLKEDPTLLIRKRASKRSKK